MMPLMVKSSLFWRYQGEVMSSWYLCGDGMTDAHRSAHLDWCRKYGCDTVVLNLNNEECMSLFSGGYMRAISAGRYATLRDYCALIRRQGGKVVLALYDGPESPGAKYHPILSQSSLHGLFIAGVCFGLGHLADAILIGVETNRYASIEQVEDVIAQIKRLLPLMPCGTHEQNVRRTAGGYVLARPIPRNADFHAYETINHPADGDSVAVSDLVAETRFLVEQSGGRGVWVMEFNTNADGEHSRAQARALAELPGVIGVGGPL